MRKMNDATRQRVHDHLSQVMERLVQKRVVDEPFNPDEMARNNPFGSLLVPTEIWKGSKFERSFVTTLGQGIFEQLGKIIAEGAGAHATNQYDSVFTINTWRNEKIEEILAAQRSSTRVPDWEVEVAEILALNNQNFTEVKVKFDLYVHRADGTEEFYGFKTVKPNLDQTERAKRDMLRMKAGNPNAEVYFALPFNPAGEGEVYRNAHAIPYKLFDMDNTESVLIGAELWNKIGDDPNTYQELLEVFADVGAHYSAIIYRDYLNL